MSSRAKPKTPSRPPLPPPATAPASRCNGREPKAKKTFVFGSSTPRELSHISSVSRRHRLIEKPKFAEQDERRGRSDAKDITYYMRLARSVTPAGSAGSRSGWAFGSSTPRELSHLGGLVRPEQRVYNAKLGGRPSDFPANRSLTTSAIAPAGNHTHSYGGKGAATADGDDAASEPDLVRDRQAMANRSAFKATADGEKRKSKKEHKARANAQPTDAVKEPKVATTAVGVEAKGPPKEGGKPPVDGAAAGPKREERAVAEKPAPAPVQETTRAAAKPAPVREATRAAEESAKDSGVVEDGGAESATDAPSQELVDSTSVGDTPRS